jgi:hypothetical protein
MPKAWLVWLFLAGAALAAPPDAFLDAQKALDSSNKRRGNEGLKMLLQENRLVVIRSVQVRPDLRIEYVQSAACADLDAARILRQADPTALPAVRIPSQGRKVQKKALFYYANAKDGDPEIKGEEQVQDLVVECHPYDQEALAAALRRLLAPLSN